MNSTITTRTKLTTDKAVAIFPMDGSVRPKVSVLNALIGAAIFKFAFLFLPR
jgi:hypothetical protein